MRTLTIALAVTAVGALPASAAAHTGATVLHGAFAPAGPVLGSSLPDHGRAVLVDGRPRDVLRIGVQRLAPHTRYVFRLRQGRVACRPEAPGIDVPGWRYRARGLFATDRLGSARAAARSRTFQVQPGVAYYVGVYSLTDAGTPGRLVVCAALRERPPAALADRG